MNKKFTESRARCSNTARRPMSIYDIGEKRQERERENEITDDSVGIEATWTPARCLGLDQFYITERLKHVDLTLVRLTVSLVSRLHAKIVEHSC